MTTRKKPSSARRYLHVIFGTLALWGIWMGHTLCRAAYSRGWRVFGWIIFILGLIFGTVTLGIFSMAVVDDEDLAGLEDRMIVQFEALKTVVATGTQTPTRGANNASNVVV